MLILSCFCHFQGGGWIWHVQGVSSSIPSPWIDIISFKLNELKYLYTDFCSLCRHLCFTHILSVQIFKVQLFFCQLLADKTKKAGLYSQNLLTDKFTVGVP